MRRLKTRPIPPGIDSGEVLMRLHRYLLAAQENPSVSDQVLPTPLLRRVARDLLHIFHPNALSIVTDRVANPNGVGVGVVIDGATCTLALDSSRAAEVLSQIETQRHGEYIWKARVRSGGSKPSGKGRREHPFHYQLCMSRDHEFSRTELANLELVAADIDHLLTIRLEKQYASNLSAVFSRIQEYLKRGERPGTLTAALLGGSLRLSGRTLEYFLASRRPLGFQSMLQFAGRSAR